MNKFDKKVQFCCENSFDLLYHLESIIKLTKSVCLEKEFNSSYYNLPNKYRHTLSEERNHYINMLSLAQDKIDCLKEINQTLENELL